MNKIKIDERFENAINAFFETPAEEGSMALKYGFQDELVVAVEPAFSEKFGKWSSLLRELLLFGPGTFCLYYITLFLIFFYPTLGIPIPGLISLAACSFMTYAGAGDIRQTKNLAVPATVIAGAALVAFVRSIFPVPEDLTPYFSYAIYSFPLVLGGAKLVQMWLAEEK